jgi:hypothetical protein
MSYNITLVIDEHGKVTIDEEKSYTNTAPRNARIAISGHVVPQDEQGSESLAVTLYEDLEGFGVALQASTSKSVDRRPDGSDSA